MTIFLVVVVAWFVAGLLASPLLGRLLKASSERYPNAPE
jgi:hypothetical protein